MSYDPMYGETSVEDEQKLRESNYNLIDLRDVCEEAQYARKYLYIQGYLTDRENFNVLKRIRKDEN